eukprot:3878803-Prymnesium_polylepis.1
MVVQRGSKWVVLGGRGEGEHNESTLSRSGSVMSPSAFFRPPSGSKISTHSDPPLPHAYTPRTRVSSYTGVSDQSG